MDFCLNGFHVKENIFLTSLIIYAVINLGIFIRMSEFKNLTGFN